MDPLANAVDGFRSVAQSVKEYFDSLARRVTNRSRRKPVEILKRLQRETFSDLMKLRDRQDKVERMLSFYGSSRKGSPFQEASTHVRGEIDAVGSLLFVDNVEQDTCNILKNAGLVTGVNSKFIFETVVREKDTLIAEFVARNRSQGFHDDVPDSFLTLKTVKYLANINDWLSAIAIPIGTRFKDIAFISSPFQNPGLTDFSSFIPTFLNQYNGSTVGLMMKGRNVFASLAESVSCLGKQSDSAGIVSCLSTFAQVTYQPIEGTKITFLGMERVPMLRTQNIHLDSLNIPMSSFRFHGSSLTSEGSSYLSAPRNPSGSLAVMLETEFDENARIGGWIELQKASAKNLRWAFLLCDLPEDELGWGLSLGGSIRHPRTLVHFQLEAFLKLSLGKRFSLQPGLLYAINERHSVPALVLRSSWSL